MDRHYVEDLVAERLAALGYPGTVIIRPRAPLAVRIETGERARFVIAYRGRAEIQFMLDDWDVIKGTTGAPLAHALADKILEHVPVARAA